MYYNRFPDRNIGFIPYVHKILDMLDNESLAIEPIQLNFKLDGGREMKNNKEVCGTCTHVCRTDNDTTGMECSLGDFPVSYNSKCQHSDSEYMSIATVAKAEEEELKRSIKEGEEMSNPICVECHTEMDFDTGEAKCSDCLTSDYGGHCIDDDIVEAPREVQSRSLLNYKVGKCPGCGIGDLWVMCKSKDDIEAHSGVCDYCGHVDIG